MKRFLLPLLLLFSLAASHPFHPFQRSVFPLSAVIQEGDEQNLINICSVFSINPPKGWFMTAAHCIVEEDLFIGNPLHQVMVQEIDTTNDIAVLWSDQPAVGLKLRMKPVHFEEEVRIPSFQLGLWTFMLIRGNIINPSTIPLGWNKAYLLYSVQSCRGSSGAPIVDREGRVVGVVQVGVIRYELCGGIGGASTLEQLHKFKKYFLS